MSNILLTNCLFRNHVDETRQANRETSGYITRRVLTVKTLTSIEEISAAAWNALVSADMAPVMRWQWLFAMEASKSACIARGWQPHHFTLWRGNELVAVAPAYLKFHSMGEYIYDFGWAHAAPRFGVEYYPKLLVTPPLSPLTAPRLLFADAQMRDQVVDHFCRWVESTQRKHNLSSAHVLFSTNEEQQQLANRGFLSRETLQFHWTNQNFETYDDFLQKFDSKRRHQLKRERRAATEQNLTLVTLTNEALESEHAKLAFEFYASTAQKNGFQPVQLTRAFFENIFESLKENIEFVVAKRDEKIIAGAFNLFTSSHLYGRYWGALEELPFLHFNVCFYQGIERCITAGRKVFEPGAGGEHKIIRGFLPTKVYSSHLIPHQGFRNAIARSLEIEKVENSQAIENGARWARMK